MISYLSYHSSAILRASKMSFTCSVCLLTYTRKSSLVRHNCHGIPHEVPPFPFHSSPRHFESRNGSECLRQILYHYCEHPTLLEDWIKDKRLYHVTIRTGHLDYLDMIQSEFIPISGQECTCVMDIAEKNHIHYIGYRKNQTSTSIDNKVLLYNKLSEYKIVRGYNAIYIADIPHFLASILYIQKVSGGTHKYHSDFDIPHNHSLHTWTIPCNWKKSVVKLYEKVPNMPSHWLEAVKDELIKFHALQLEKINIPTTVPITNNYYVTIANIESNIVNH